MIIEILCLRVFSSYNNIATFNLQWYRARDLFGSQIPETTVGFELRNLLHTIWLPNPLCHKA